MKATFDSVNKSLCDVCEREMKQTIPGKQLVPMTDASFRSEVYAVMIEDNPDQIIQWKRKPYAPVAFGPKNLSPAQLKLSICSQKFLANYMAFLEFVGSNKTNTRSDRQQIRHTFFPDKSYSTVLWNACDYKLQFNSKKGHIAGSVHTTADFLCRLQLKVTEKIRLNIRGNVQTTPIEVTASSS